MGAIRIPGSVHHCFSPAGHRACSVLVDPVVTTAIITDTERATERTGNQPGGETQAAGTLIPTTEVGRVLQHATVPYF